MGQWELNDASPCVYGPSILNWICCVTYIVHQQNRSHIITNSISIMHQEGQIRQLIIHNNHTTKTCQQGLTMGLLCMAAHPGRDPPQICWALPPPARLWSWEHQERRGPGSLRPGWWAGEPWRTPPLRARHLAPGTRPSGCRCGWSRTCWPRQGPVWGGSLRVWWFEICYLQQHRVDLIARGNDLHVYGLKVYLNLSLIPYPEETFCR